MSFLQSLPTRAPDITFITKFTATSTDMLSGTEMDTFPGDGILAVWCASTVNTATLEAPGRYHQTGKTNYLPLETSGVPHIEKQMPWVMPVKGNQRPILILGGTTGTVYLMACYWRG